MMAPGPFKTTPRFEKIAFSCQDNPLPARIADWSSRNAVSFSSAGYNETLSITAMRVNNPDCSPVGINR
jgi:hypothetical protein